MRYQLVLQFRGSSLEDLDALVALEDSLIGQLAGVAVVDGHDIGSGEANVFIFTSDPMGTFDLVKPVLDRAHLLAAVTAAYRSTEGENYTVVWPKQSTNVFHVA